MADEISVPRPPGFWDAVRADYDKGHKIGDICARHGISAGEFAYHRQQGGWPKRNRAPVNRERLVGRIVWLIDQQVRQMEAQMTNSLGTEKPADVDVALLNQLVGSLGRLIRFEGGQPAKGRAPRETNDLQDIRQKLVQRIEELKRD